MRLNHKTLERARDITRVAYLFLKGIILSICARSDAGSKRWEFFVILNFVCFFFRTHISCASRCVWQQQQKCNRVWPSIHDNKPVRNTNMLPSHSTARRRISWLHCKCNFLTPHHRGCCSDFLAVKKNLLECANWLQIALLLFGGAWERALTSHIIYLMPFFRMFAFPPQFGENRPPRGPLSSRLHLQKENILYDRLKSNESQSKKKIFSSAGWSNIPVTAIIACMLRFSFQTPRRRVLCKRSMRKNELIWFRLMFIAMASTQFEHILSWYLITCDISGPSLACRRSDDRKVKNTQNRESKL